MADIAKLSVGREEYYTRELATDHEAYLSGHGESPGRWYGAGAATLGLQGEASAAGFKAMFEGRDPTTGALLGRPHGRNAVPAFDVVLRPTKSVSILYGLGDPAIGRAVLSAHHGGLVEAVGELDDDGKLPDKSAEEEPPVEELSRRVQSASEALNHFDRMAANEVQDRRPRRLLRRLTGNRGRDRPDGGEDQDY